jgi:hypothetical protein
MPSWGNIKAWVSIGTIPDDSDDEDDNSQELPEYLVESSDDHGVPCVSCWVPSIANEVRMRLAGSSARPKMVLM